MRRDAAAAPAKRAAIATRRSDGTPPGTGATPQPAGNADRLALYLASIRARITGQRPRAPGLARGLVEVRFDVAADGRLGAVAVARSDDDALDRAAVDLVRRAFPVAPIPPALGRAVLSMAVAIEFR